MMKKSHTSLRLFRGVGAGLLVYSLAVFTSACGATADGAAPGSPASSGGAASSAAQNQPATTGQPVKIRFGLDTAAGGSLQFRQAQEQGFFKKYAVEAEISNFAYGIDTINALLVQRTDTAMAADYALLNSLGKGDMKIVSTLTRATEASSRTTVLLVKGGITKPEELKGKKLGVARGTVYEYVWAKFLEKLSIDEKDVKMVYYSTPDEAIVALSKREMDAVWSGGALLEKFLKVDGIKSLGDMNQTDVKISSFQVVDAGYLKTNVQTVTNYLKAVKDGIDYIPAHKEQTAELAFRDIKLPKDGVLKDLDTQNYVLGFTKEDYQHLQNMKTWLEQRGILKDKYELKDKIDVEALKAAFPDTVTYTK